MTKFFTVISTVIAAIVFSTAAGAAQSPQLSSADFSRFLEVSGANQLFDQLIVSLKNSGLGKDEAKFKKASTAFRKEVTEESFKIHQKHFSSAEMKDIIGFYTSDAGKKFVKLIPGIQAYIVPKLQSASPPSSQVPAARKPLVDRLMKAMDMKNPSVNPMMTPEQVGLIADYTGEYLSQNMADDELKAIAAFHETGAGAKMIQKKPEINKESSQLSMRLSQKYLAPLASSGEGSTKKKK